MITGINHITLSVNDINESFDFYVEVLGLHPIMRCSRSVYLLSGDTWIALVVDKNARRAETAEYTHFAFTVAEDDFDAMSDRIRRSGAVIWQDNKTEGASLYFTDPNGHKLEIHASDLENRLETAKKEDWEGLKAFDR
ncbi:MAG: glutathione transferase [bacterium]|nr:glutathione transferase [bacterium]